MSRLHYRFVGLLVAVATLTSVAAGADPFFLTGPNETRRVAITFDDLPAARNSFLPELLANPKQFRTRNAKVLRQLRKLGVPVEGFVSNAFVPKTWTDDDMRQLLETWESEGALLGNHTTIHRDFHEMAIEDYFQTIRGGQEYLDKILPSAAAKGKYFRAPYLHRGKFPQDRERLEAYLNAHGYQAAPVTIDLQDWFFAEVYAWAAANHDEAKKKTVVKAYLTYLGAAIEHFALLSAVVTGR